MHWCGDHPNHEKTLAMLEEVKEVFRNEIKTEGRAEVESSLIATGFKPSRTQTASSQPAPAVDVRAEYCQSASVPVERLAIAPSPYLTRSKTQAFNILSAYQQAEHDRSTFDINRALLKTLDLSQSAKFDRPKINTAAPASEAQQPARFTSRDIRDYFSSSGSSPQHTSQPTSQEVTMSLNPSHDLTHNPQHAGPSNEIQVAAANDIIVMNNPNSQREHRNSQDSVLGHATPRTPKTPKPLPMKNDAIPDLVKELQQYWGRRFIETFIPEPQRPLVKRIPGAKRNTKRYPQNDPMKWKPAVLRGMLMIAKKTKAKARLRKLMADVVDYRIRHTGNKKHELVTTDFDVIDDVIERGWTVVQAFELRYRHLSRTRSGLGRGKDEDSQENKSGDAEDVEMEDEEIREPSPREKRTYRRARISSMKNENRVHHQAHGYALRQQHDAPQMAPQMPPHMQNEQLRQPNPFLEPARSALPGTQFHIQQHGHAQPITLTPSHAESEELQRNASAMRGHQNIQSRPVHSQSQAQHQASRVKSEIKIEQCINTPCRSRQFQVETPESGIGGKKYSGSDDDDEWLRAQLEVAEAKEKKAELRLQLLERRRAKKMGANPSNPMTLE
ncbi:hypothetical protein K469DRAFT_689033 [Zopfia rhizophila CBS 207.26]|uniref:Uncharacterized protein n=1 Tax=Zopfia rhizophila CBS 207.26 TaxID=1314779 RepID=A0A6A6ESK1_9PEZI|nr:hypothetical protein K469DRAFT_689033 [Zopfia rhizophila CBS 207.26]